MEKLYTVKEFAEVLRCHPNTVRRMIKDKRLHPVRVGSIKRPQYLISENDLLRLLAESFEDEQTKGE